MTIERIIREDGSICEKITLTDQESAEIDRCHEILRLRFEDRGEIYTKGQYEMCEWWLQGLLRYEGVERMVSMAQNAPFHDEEKTVLTGYAEIQIVKGTEPVHAQYTRQILAIREIASKLGAVAYRHSDHGIRDDKNTIKLYTVEDAAHNRLVVRRTAQYSREEAAVQKRDGTAITDKRIYRDSFWSFENSDAEGRFSWDYANRGLIDLRLPDWRERLEGHISLALLRKRQCQYVCQLGGWFALQEADETYNGFNRSIITAMKHAFGNVYLGCINYSGKQKEQVCTGEGSIYEEYTGQEVYNGSYAFAVPEKDAHLEKLIYGWNAGSVKDSEQIIKRINEIGGEYFVWR